MKEGFYTHPTNNKIKRGRVAVVVTTFIHESQNEMVCMRRRSNENTLAYQENKLELLKFSIARYQHYNPGVDFDLVIVDNSSPNEEAQKYLKKLSDERVKVLSRENTGFSFAAAEYAYKTFLDEYDYYFFCEQDAAASKDYWLRDLINVFLSDRNIGAVGNVVEDYRYKEFFDSHPEYNLKMLGEYSESKNFRQCNLDGMAFLTSSSVLKKLYENGGFNIQYMSPKNTYDTWDVNPVNNELFWMHNLLNMGYELVGHNDGNHIYAHGITHADFGEMDQLPLEKLSPIMHGQTLYSNKRMREYFSWYKDMENFPFYGSQV